MTDHTPPTDQQLTEYETLANAATDGPWGVYQYGGDSLIEIAADLENTGCGYQARRTICRFDEEPLDNDPAHREWTADRIDAYLWAVLIGFDDAALKEMATRHRWDEHRIKYVREMRALLAPVTDPQPKEPSA